VIHAGTGPGQGFHWGVGFGSVRLTVTVNGKPFRACAPCEETLMDPPSLAPATPEEQYWADRERPPWR
jgi:hypothetical protein